MKYTENNFDFLKHLNLADSGTIKEINVLLGFNFYWSLLTGKVKMDQTGELVARETKFGWVLNGSLIEKTSQGHLTVVNKKKIYVLNLRFEPTKIFDRTKIVSLEQI